MGTENQRQPRESPLNDLPRRDGILDDLLAELPGVVYRCRNDRNWTMLGLSRKVEELTGYTPSDLVDNHLIPFADLIHPEDRKGVWTEIQEAVGAGVPFQVIYRLRTRRGEERWVLEEGQVTDQEPKEVSDGEDRAVLMGYIQDITGPLADRLAESRQEVEAVRRQARHLELLQSVTGIVNRERRLVDALRAALPEICRFLDFSVGHVFLGRRGDERTTEDPEKGESKLSSSDLWYMEEGVKGLDYFREATEKGGWDLSRGLPGRVMREGRVEWIPDVKADPDFYRVGSEDHCPVTAGVGFPVISEERTLAVVELYTHQDMENDPGLPGLLDQVGTQLGRVWEREEASREMGAAEERFRQIAERIDDVFWIRSPDLDRVEYVSPAYQDLVGQPVESLYRDPKDWLDHVHAEDRERILEKAEESAEKGFEEEYRIVRPDGEIRWVWDRAFPVRDEEGKVYRIIGVAEDITERKELEAQLLQSQKMEAVGRLAGGVAHDFNNLLTVIQAHTDFLLMDLGPSHPLAEDTRTVRDAADRAALLTRQLLAFGREQVLRPRTVDLNEVLLRMEKLLRRILGEDIRIETRPAPTLPPIRVDPVQLEQVIMNLAVNARDAMPQGGTLRLATHKKVLDQATAAANPELEPGLCVCLTVADTGTGMDEDTLSRIFEPFFTTKEGKKGTGLGLATSYGIVKQSGGSIQVKSEPGKGTAFFIRFPPAEGGREESGPDAAEGRENRKLTGTILLVEDDAKVRRTARRILENAGFDVRTAGDAETGLEILLEGEAVDLVVTDLVLPGMAGTELVRKARERFPDLPLVAMSGYADGPMGEGPHLTEEVPLVRKPFSPGQLVDAVSRELAGG
jgi:PAS domain S-box-containing protein